MKTVIEMAREAGLHEARENPPYFGASALTLERFAELVRADERDRAMRENAYVAYEREQCAQIVETASDYLQNSSFEGVAAAIRARGQS